MTQMCFKRDNNEVRTWFLDYPLRGDSPSFNHEYFDTENANLAVKILKNKYDINAKKVLRFDRSHDDMYPYNIKVSFKNDEDELFFIVKASNGIDI